MFCMFPLEDCGAYCMFWTILTRPGYWGGYWGAAYWKGGGIRSELFWNWQLKFCAATSWGELCFFSVVVPWGSFLILCWGGGSIPAFRSALRCRW